MGAYWARRSGTLRQRNVRQLEHRDVFRTQFGSLISQPEPELQRFVDGPRTKFSSVGVHRQVSLSCDFAMFLEEKFLTLRATVRNIARYAPGYDSGSVTAAYQRAIASNTRRRSSCGPLSRYIVPRRHSSMSRRFTKPRLTSSFRRSVSAVSLIPRTFARSCPNRNSPSSSARRIAHVHLCSKSSVALRGGFLALVTARVYRNGADPFTSIGLVTILLQVDRYKANIRTLSSPHGKQAQ
jgi:hypothetical protein